MNQRNHRPETGENVPGLAPRRAALRLMDAVLRRGETLDNAAHPATQGLSQPDKALARALAGEAMRWMVDLDALIDSATRQVLPDDAKPRAVLRLMLAGWLRLETPPHAVVATGLELLQGGPRRLAHGVFSALVKQGVTLPETPTLPAGAAGRWGERGAAIAAGLAVPPPLDLTVKAGKDAPEGLSLMPGHVRLSRGDAVESLPGFAAGDWWVQDLAASLPARLIGAGAGRVLDVCAAPGGKTMQLAAAGWDVTALDNSAKRIERMRANLERTGLSADLVATNALKYEPEALFDAVLLDAPCTATGTCRRHPDVLHRIGARQIAEMAELQQALLERAAGWLKPGGVLVYAVCSLEREEGEEQAAKVTLTPDPIRAEELPPGVAPTAEGWLRTDPGMLGEAGGLDGFFVARWRK
ncbi:RsmB/NOP family class I SAM-dependent RNA methyltransferase [Novosphingobium sp. KACC 22771]|uniref:RsmB/NOP family class I SAM-dependent RNA methyltransferase n=1 Tax=Novosphingobium sp. KACC 22771 TaxID=3025670 RepID=UPI002366F489|nr:methyltransferase domain-containing protein [Novosphingobium sp. KACC 22771]WDF72094.1 methyltransferase domain-containing protein [Novosphingobium sp. KACC 22771]